MSSNQENECFPILVWVKKCELYNKQSPYKKSGTKKNYMKTENWKLFLASHVETMICNKYI